MGAVPELLEQTTATASERLRTLAAERTAAAA
jgi:hypothetical protein